VHELPQLLCETLGESCCDCGYDAVEVCLTSLRAHPWVPAPSSLLQLQCSSTKTPVDAAEASIVIFLILNHSVVRVRRCSLLGNSEKTLHPQNIGFAEDSQNKFSNNV
jgi:hypothetical protein